MIFGYKVNHNGTYYSAWEEVPVVEVEAETGSEPDFIEDELPFSDTEIEMEEEPARRGRPRKSDL